MLPSNERIELEVILNTRQADAALREVVEEAEELSAVIQELAASSGASFKQAATYIKQYLKEVYKIDIPAKQLAEALKLATLETKNLYKSSLQLLKTEEQLAAAASKPAQFL